MFLTSVGNNGKIGKFNKTPFMFPAHMEISEPEAVVDLSVIKMKI